MQRSEMYCASNRFVQVHLHHDWNRRALAFCPSTMASTLPDEYARVGVIRSWAPADIARAHHASEHFRQLGTIGPYLKPRKPDRP